MHLEPDDFENTEHDGLAKAYKTFGKDLYSIIDEMNDILLI